ncbi:MAG: aminotransferase class III-fold pyridoxal phosphate-dependent enzyme [bacterium]
MKRPDFSHSRVLLERARRVIPSATQTFSKSWSQFVEGASPNFLERGEGAYVFDVDGNRFTDYIMALGAISFGYGWMPMEAAARIQLKKGLVFTMPHPLEIEVAELLVKTVPCAEMVRFGKNGSDATSGAVRVARAVTGRDKIACCGYHGWQDWYIASTTRNLGIPKFNKELIFEFQYNEINSLKKILDENPGKIAAVIMEPVGVIEPQDNFLSKVRDLTTKAGALLIFDEVVTGFRMALGGAQELYGVVPDLSTCGKGMGNGVPISAVVGKREYMEYFDKVFFSFTFGGEALSLAVCKTVIEHMDEAFYQHIWQLGERFKNGYNRLADALNISQVTDCLGIGPRAIIRFLDEKGAFSYPMKSYFQQECFKRGELFYGSIIPCLAHTEEIVDHSLRVYGQVMELLADALQKGDLLSRLEGPVIQPIFRKV